MNIAFIVGSPRSGTTLLGDILNLHPKIGRWYEPYFIIDRFFRNTLDDSLTAEDATDEVRDFVVSAFNYYGSKLGCQWVIDKSPRNSLKIPFLRKVFPSAKFIHLIRDGRDTVLSINREWRRRELMIGAQKRPFEILKVVWRFANRQPLLIHKLAAVNFETGGALSRIRREPFLHKIRWENRVGWGPRFPGWQKAIDKVSTIEFNALQWTNCVNAILNQADSFNTTDYLSIRYETLLQQPEKAINSIFNFLKVTAPNQFINQLPVLEKTNFGKWKYAFSQDEIAQIGPIINPVLLKLGDADDESWYLGVRK